MHRAHPGDLLRHDPPTAPRGVGLHPGLERVGRLRRPDRHDGVQGKTPQHRRLGRIVHPRQQKFQRPPVADASQTLNRLEAHETVRVPEREVEQLGRLIVTPPGQLGDSRGAHPAIRISQAGSQGMTHARSLSAAGLVSDVVRCLIILGP
jgi:hypothetical protein